MRRPSTAGAATGARSPDAESGARRDSNPAEAFAGRSVLVTGASGFIGGHLCRSLLALGAQVHGLSRSGSGPEAPGLKTWAVDAADLDALRPAVEAARPDYVFHLASHVKGAPDREHVLPAFRDTLQSTVNLLCVLADIGCKRAVLTGSQIEPAPGEVETVPSSPYAAAKWAAAHYAQLFNAHYGLPSVIARVFAVYGPEQRDPSKLLPYVIRSFANRQAPEISSGQRPIDWIYVQDVVDGMIAMATAPGLEGQSVDLGSGDMIATRDLVLKIADLMGVDCAPQFGALPDRKLEPVRHADIARSERLTGWRPNVSLEQGLRMTIDHYRGQAA